MKYYKKIIRPILDKIDSETLHVTNRWILHAMEANRIALKILEKLNYKGQRFRSKKLEVRIGNLKFDNPLIVGAGWDKPGITVRALASLGFGGVEVGTVVLSPQKGNPRPRYLIKKGVSLNSYGFNNPGADRVVENLIRYSNDKIPMGISIGKNKDAHDSAEAYSKVVERLYEFASYFAINVSSPNTKGLRRLQKGNALEEIVKGVKQVTAKQGRAKPVFVKISPDLSLKTIDEIINVVLKNKITGIIAVNTTNNRKLKKRHGWEAKDGGLAGDDDVFRKMSTRIISYIYRQTQGKIVIIGVGGIKDTRTALEKIKAGASLLQIVTGIHGEGPTIAGRINRGLVKYMKENKIKNISDIVISNNMRH